MIVARPRHHEVRLFQIDSTVDPHIAKISCLLSLSLYSVSTSMPLQFTENAVATRPVRCERVSCGTIIQPGQPRIAKEDITQHIKYVCGPCGQYYDDKEAAAKLGNVTHTGTQ